MHVMRAAVIVVVGIFSAITVPAQAPVDDRDRLASGSAIEAGRRLFQEACSACHGQNGAGGHGPSLVDGQRVRRLDDAQLTETIRKGVPGTDMPPSPLPEPEIKRMIAFVRSLGALAIDSGAPGNPEVGRGIFFGKGECSSCHAIAGEGRFFGPDLTDAGVTRTIGQLRESILTPGKRIADGFRGVTVLTRSGRRIGGVAKNYDNYSVQILDSSGKLHLLARGEIEKLDFREGSLMPDDYGSRLSAKEVEDVLAYLSRQSARPREKR